MTEQERAKRIGELRTNLLVFNTPGFDRVISDLTVYIDFGLVNLPVSLKAVKNEYKRELQELEDNIDSKYKQGRLL